MRLVHDAYSEEQLDFEKDRAAGISGLLLKGGQGAWPDFPRVEPKFADRMDNAGFPWGIYWQFDARRSPEETKAAIKAAFPTGYFGKLGLWIAVEYPYYGPLVNETTYWLFKYAKYTNVESIWRGVYAYTGVYPGIYTSVSKWNLIFGSYTNPDPRKASRALQEEIAQKSGLMVAQYGNIAAPDKFGAWQGRYTGWQFRENPDYSYFTDEWFDRCMGHTPEPPTVPVDPPIPPIVPTVPPTPEVTEIKSIAIVVNSSTDGISLKSVLINDTIDAISKSTIKIEVPVVEVPQSEDVVVDDIRYGVIKAHPSSNDLTRAGGYTPATSPLQDIPQPNGNKGAAIPVHNPAWSFMRKINNDPGYKYCQSVSAMWINTSYSDPNKAHAESIDCMCNVVSWKKGDIENTCYHLISFQSSDDFNTFDPNKFNWFKRPELFIKPQSVNLDATKWIKVGSGVDAYIPLMARSKQDGGTGNLWIDIRDVEPFPDLPCTVMIEEKTGLNIRILPGIENKGLGYYLLNDFAKILEYRPLGNAVWGRTIKGWICLRLVDGSFPTTWKLSTPRVLPPV